MTQAWKELQEKLVKKYGTKAGKSLSEKYSGAFPTNYHEECTLDQAITDITHLEKMSAEHPLDMDFYEQAGTLFLRLFQYQDPIPLSDILPLLENMDLRTLSERPYEIKPTHSKPIWISDFSVAFTGTAQFAIAEVKDNFQDAFIQARCGAFEKDGFNKLVLGAELSWREVSIIRAYAKYLHQIGFRYTQAYIERTAAIYADIMRDLVQLFHLLHAPKQKNHPKKAIETLEKSLYERLEKVTSLDEDRILRRFWQVIKATLRTNYFQTDADNHPKPYISFKLDSEQIPELPLPHPLYEIFVYSSRFEGIHLRSTKVARGGIRWSDRYEDFRTEILGLMKAQKVKNAIIVPSGAKGGFVLKTLPSQANRETTQKEVVACYQLFIRGLLDLTDNLQDDNVIRPPNVVCYDEADPYFVVAADKGTATFSDIANSIAKEYNFWLGDAFASGGSAGYDHKKIGITARGAWESIKRHFRELDINIEKTDITTVGIGDMSGDVFGNGMIYSSHIKLIAAFDHRNIFIDPNPDPEKSYQERVRMFNLPTSSWEDYSAKLISTGGGIYKRSSKSISVSAEAKKALGLTETTFTPNELIRAILKAPVDLLFNGGIGTYVKASTESHTDVGDKSNEYCRINGNELRCRIVGEGGNLGFTQLGRIEYALQGGVINTDFIDNSAGVDCSDHEVNIKILLDQEVKKGKLTEKKRDQLLVKMTDEVAALVLKDNYDQALTLSYSNEHLTAYTGLYQGYIKELETTVKLDRTVEFIPDDKKLLERKANGQGLARPELAVLLAYTKIYVKNELLQSHLPDDPYFFSALETAFPATLAKLYPESMKNHRLRREIIATQLGNHVVNSMGITFVYRLQMETGATVDEIARAYIIASRVYRTVELQKLVDTLSFKIPMKVQYQSLHHIRQLLNLATRWFLRNRRSVGDLTKIINHYAPAIQTLESLVPKLISGITKTYMESVIEQFTTSGLPRSVAEQIAITRGMYTALNVIEVGTLHKFDLVQTAKVYFDVGAQFNFVWFRDQIANDSREGHWNSLARLTLRDELDLLQRGLTIVILQSEKKTKRPENMIASWMTKQQRVRDRWEKLLAMLHGSNSVDYTMFFVALRELAELVQTAQ